MEEREGGNERLNAGREYRKLKKMRHRRGDKERLEWKETTGENDLRE